MTLTAFLVLAQPIIRNASSGQREIARAPRSAFDPLIRTNALQLLEEGRQIFRFDTFGDEVFWGDTLQLHLAIEGEAVGGVGPGVSPNMALALGLKVDVEALPPELVAALKQGKVDLDDPATTLALLQLNAVVGVTGFFQDQGTLRSIGIQCALCHSTVDDSFTLGIGRRRCGRGGSCGRAAEEFLRQKGMPYEGKDIQADPSAAESFLWAGTPFLLSYPPQLLASCCRS